MLGEGAWRGARDSNERRRTWGGTPAEAAAIAEVERRKRRIRKRRRCICLIVAVAAVVGLAFNAAAIFTKFVAWGNKSGSGAAPAAGEVETEKGIGVEGEDEWGEILTMTTSKQPTEKPTDTPIVEEEAKNSVTVTTEPAPQPELETDPPTPTPTPSELEGTESPTAPPTASPTASTSSPTSSPTPEASAEHNLEPTIPVTSSPTVSPNSTPTNTPAPTLFIPYSPGELTSTSEDGALLLSAGLSATKVITSWDRAVYPDGTVGPRFHSKVAAGGVFPLPSGFLIPGNALVGKRAKMSAAATTTGEEGGETDVAVEDEGGLDAISGGADRGDDVVGDDGDGNRPDEVSDFNIVPDGGYAYITNSKNRNNNGKVGVIYFGPDGTILGYATVLNNVNVPSGGGPTPWGTWIAVEEGNDGKVWEVDPLGAREAAETVLGGNNTIWGGFAYDDREKAHMHFYLTEYSADGPIRRYTPPRETIKSKDDPSFRVLLAEGGIMEYLSLSPEKARPEHPPVGHGGHDEETEGGAAEGGPEGEGADGQPQTMTPTTTPPPPPPPPKSRGWIEWTEDEGSGRDSAVEHMRGCRGVARLGPNLYFVSETNKELVIIDLDRMKFVAYGTGSMFVGAPDALVAVPPAGSGGAGEGGGGEGAGERGGVGGKDPHSPHRMESFDSAPLLFVTDRFAPRTTEGGGGGGVTQIQGDGSHRQLLRTTDDRNWVNGLAFSPNGRRMYVALRHGKDSSANDVLYEATRDDGGAFNVAF